MNFQVVLAGQGGKWIAIEYWIQLQGQHVMAVHRLYLNVDLLAGKMR